MADFALTWTEFDASNALPSAVSGIISSLEAALSTIETFLNAVVAVFNVLKTFIISVDDFLKTVLEALRADIEALIETLQEAGIRVLVHFPRGVGTALSPAQWVASVSRSMTDAGDKNRPDFSTNQGMAGALVMIALPDFLQLLAGAKGLVEALGKPFKYRDNIVGLREKTDEEKEESGFPPFLIDKDELYAQYTDTISLSGTRGPSFVVGETVLGLTSGAEATIVRIETANSVAVRLFVRLDSVVPFEVAETIAGRLSGGQATMVTYTTGNIAAHRGGGLAPDWSAPILLKDVFPPFQLLANVLKRALGLLVFGLGFADLIDQYVAFIESKLAIIQGLVDELQEVVAVFEALLALTDVHVLFFEGTGTTVDLQRAIAAAGLPEGMAEQGTLLVAGGLALHVAGDPTSEIAETVALLRGLFGAF